jgi:hypothetical protein
MTMIANQVAASARCLCCGKRWAPDDKDMIRTNVAAHQRIWQHAVVLTVVHSITFRVIIRP